MQILRRCWGDDLPIRRYHLALDSVLRSGELLWESPLGPELISALMGPARVWVRSQPRVMGK